MSTTPSVAEWEAMYAPYDRPTYEAVLQFLQPQDIVLDIGAGDLRLAWQMAGRGHKVYAVEMNRRVLEQGVTSPEAQPGRLILICGDARWLDFPADVTVGVLLMRHCAHFRLYFEKLRKVGAKRLITNARWRMSVEEIDLRAERVPFSNIRLGWYACVCGATGFQAGPVEQWSSELDQVVQEVAECPECKEDRKARL